MRNYIFIPKISVSPNKVAVFNEVSWYGKMTAAEKREQNRILHGGEVEAPAETKPILEKKFHNFDISENIFHNLFNRRPRDNFYIELCF